MSDVDRLFADVREVRLDPSGEILVPQQVDPTFSGVNDHGVVIASRPCRSCGYDLRGLTMADACPECHWPVARSVAGSNLSNSPPEHVRVLRAGITTVISAQLVGLGAGVFGFIAGAVLMGGGNLAGIELIGLGASILVSITNLIGWWIFSSPDPALAAEEQRTNSRRVLRAFAVATFVGYLGTFLVKLLYHQGVIPAGSQITFNLGGTPMPIGSGVDLALGALAALTALLNVVVTSVAMAYLSNICARVPDPVLQRDTKRMVWLIWVLLFVPCAGGLVSFILLLIYLFRTRTALSGVLAQHHARGELAG